MVSKSTELFGVIVVINEVGVDRRTSQRVVIMAIGSRGDIVPMVNLARGVARLGVETEIIGLSDYELLVDEECGARFHSIGLSMATMREIVEEGWGKFSERDPLVEIKLLARWIDRLKDALVSQLIEIVEKDDLLLTGVLTRDCAAAVHRHVGCRMVTIALSGVMPSSSPESCLYVTPSKAPAWLRRVRARLGWRFVTGVSRSAAREVDRRLRTRRVKTPRSKLSGGRRTILAASPTLVPRAPDWGPRVVQTGYPLEVGPGVEPNDDGVLEVLEGGAPCAYVGFGSPGENSEALWRHLEQEIVLAAELAEVNVILPSSRYVSPGWVSPNVFSVGEVDHRWLFPKVDAVIHHGGAGTTMSGLVSGTPSCVASFAFDQDYHGRRLADLGVGPAPMRVDDVDARALESRLSAMTRGSQGERYRARARELSQAVLGEGGLERTVDAVLASLRE